MGFRMSKSGIGVTLCRVNFNFKKMDVQQLITALKTKYHQSGLGENEIRGLATSLFATGLITDDNVSSIVDAQADAMKGLQSILDSRFTSQRDTLKKTLETELEKAFKEKYKIGDDGKQVAVKTQENGGDDIKAMIAQIMDEKLKPLSDKIAAEETRRAAEVRANDIIAKAKANGINEQLAKLLNVPTEVTDLDAFMKDMAQELKNLGFQPSPAPGAGGAAKTDEETIAEQIRAGAPKKD